MELHHRDEILIKCIINFILFTLQYKEYLVSQLKVINNTLLSVCKGNYVIIFFLKGVEVHSFFNKDNVMLWRRQTNIAPGPRLKF